MLRATLKSLFARKLRLILTALAVVLGVGMTAGSFILTDTALKSFDNLFGDVYKGTDVVVQGTTAFDPSGQNNTGGGSERQQIPVRRGAGARDDGRPVGGAGRDRGVEEREHGVAHGSASSGTTRSARCTTRPGCRPSR